MTGATETPTGITAVSTAQYVSDGLIFAAVQFDGATNPDGTPVYLPVTVTDDESGPDAWMLARIKSLYSITVPEFILAAARQKRRAEINAWRDAQENGSVIFTLNGHRWDCGKASQTRLSPVVAVAKSGMLPPGFFWTDADNIDVPMTTDELIALEAAMQQNMVLQGFKIHERQRQMKEEVDKLTDYKAIKDYAVGWPEGS
ncbi:DUF4376 domain-containing protein [Salmonella enterica]|nr:DUF4376 domain-containing protein [Salmonella enterica]EDD3986892.1 DUF4376 domain-containing protein [Salmonella enterica subsp. enterica serovar Panama]EEH3403131.1 DUF4376 domain-containing protein [Salmonella enterica]EHF6764754.1 DUF4376 domain-containing protein [Salmonella enterica]EHN6225805.1 DUF4376 domain-containing protein [Salmonella enterica]